MLFRVFRCSFSFTIKIYAKNVDLYPPPRSQNNDDLTVPEGPPLKYAGPYFWNLKIVVRPRNWTYFN